MLDIEFWIIRAILSGIAVIFLSKAYMISRWRGLIYISINVTFQFIVRTLLVMGLMCPFDALNQILLTASTVAILLGAYEIFKALQDIISKNGGC